MNSSKSALITGITGQDGVFLSELLLDNGYEVFGIDLPENKKKWEALHKMRGGFLHRIAVWYGSVADGNVINDIIGTHKFDEIYHFAAKSSVAGSFMDSESYRKVNVGGTLNIANAVKEHSPKSKLYFAASSEMFGEGEKKKLNEKNAFHPKNPYAESKLEGYKIMREYRKKYGLFFSNGILFNHESELRGKEFVSKKISSGVAEITSGKPEIIELGNTDMARDWGYAKDYVFGIWKILQHKKPDDFVLASGEKHTVREFAEVAFSIVGIDIVWHGRGINKVGKDKKTGKILVKINPDYFRPQETDALVGDYAKAKKILGWEPKVKFNELVKIMVDADLEKIT